MINDRHKCLAFSLKPRGIFLLEVFQMTAFISANYTRWKGSSYLGWICTSLQLLLPVKPRLLNEIIQYMIKLNEYFYWLWLNPWLWFIPGYYVSYPTLLPYLSELDQMTYKLPSLSLFFFILIWSQSQNWSWEFNRLICLSLGSTWPYMSLWIKTPPKTKAQPMLFHHSKGRSERKSFPRFIWHSSTHSNKVFVARF